MPTEDAVQPLSEREFLERLYHFLPPGHWATLETEKRIESLGGPAYNHGNVRAGTALPRVVEVAPVIVLENSCVEGCICHPHAA